MNDHTRSENTDLTNVQDQNMASQHSGKVVSDLNPPMSAAVDGGQFLRKLDFNPNRPSERGIVFMHPLHAIDANKAAYESIKAALDHFAENEIRNGRGDAFRHALWSYKLSRIMGPELAKKFTDAYEIGHPNPNDERLMDLFNNAVGRHLAADPKNQSQKDETVVLEALKRGEL
jgi:Domain of unknown function (DUF6973)